jgi:hypothetical protein
VRGLFTERAIKRLDVDPLTACRHHIARNKCWVQLGAGAIMAMVKGEPVRDERHDQYRIDLAYWLCRSGSYLFTSYGDQRAGDVPGSWVIRG